MGESQDPFHQRESLVEIALHVRVAQVEMHCLLFVGGGKLVAQEQYVGCDAAGEPGELEVPVEPPSWVLLSEHDHQE